MKTQEEDVPMNLPYNGKATPFSRPGEPVTIDGRVYKTIVITGGIEQTWLAENLQATHYSDGSDITDANTLLGWTLENKGKWCYYDFEKLNGDKFGKLYNWYALKDNKICPSGWHVPTIEDWMTLVSIVGGMGEKLKSISSEWKESNFGGTDESKFSGLPGGACESDGKFKHLHEQGIWWANKYNENKNPLCFYLYYGSPCTNLFPAGLSNGFSVRLIKD